MIHYMYITLYVPLYVHCMYIVCTLYCNTGCIIQLIYALYASLNFIVRFLTISKAIRYNYGPHRRNGFKKKVAYKSTGWRRRANFEF